MIECIICAFPIDGDERIFCLTACSHKEATCSMCFLKIRSLQRNFHCPTCKRELENIICTKEEDKSFNDFQIWGDSIGENYVREQRSQMFFPKDYYQQRVNKLWTYQCITCGQIRRDMKSLRSHCIADHNLLLCLLCDEYKQIFPSEQRTYTQHEYEKHLRFGDGDGSIGHPNCEFCRKRFYDSTALFTHLTREHYNCHLCEKSGVKFKFYQDYKDLEKHFRKDHFICEDPLCLDKKFVVFDNDIDLVAHNVQYHPNLSNNRSINIQFKYRRNGEPTQKPVRENERENAGPENTRTARYEGGFGGRAQDGEWQVEVQPQTTDPRDPNRNINTEINEVVVPTVAAGEDFPMLPTNGVGSTGSQKWMKFASDNNVQKKKNDFPGLPISTSTKVRVQTSQRRVAMEKSVPKRAASASTLPLPAEYDEPEQSIGKPVVTVVDSLSDWAKIKVDTKGKMRSSKKTQSSLSPKETIDAELEDTITSFASISPSSESGSVKVNKSSTSGKGKVSVAGVRNTDWNDALKSIGMTSSSKKQSQKPSLKVIRGGTDMANEKLVVGKKGEDSIWRMNADTKPDNNSTSSNHFASTSNSSSKKQGNWVRIGGAERDEVRKVEKVPHDPNFPGLS